MKDTYYFSHDMNARNDPDILSMRSVFGSEGYGWYWIIIEMLREQPDHKIRITKYVWNALAMQMQCAADAAHNFVHACINEHDLFASDGEYFWSESLLRRMKKYEKKSEQARKAAEARWGKRSNTKGSMQPHSERNADAYADAMHEQSDRNAIKLNEIKENNISSSSDARESFVAAHKRLFGFELSELQIEKIGSYIDDGMDERVVILALEKMGEGATGGYSVKYLMGILENYFKAGALTVEAAKIHDNKFKERQQERSRGQPQRGSGKPHLAVIESESSSMTDEEYAELLKKVERLKNG